MSRPIEPGPFVIAVAAQLVQDREKDLVGIVFDTPGSDIDPLKVALPRRAFVDMVWPLVRDWTPPA